jgi:ribosomal protein L11
MIGNISSIYAQKELVSAIAYTVNKSANSDQLKTESQAQDTKKETSLSTRVTISEEALKKLGMEKESLGSEKTPSSGVAQLSSEELQQVAELKSRDREVRSHEMAHMMVGGNLVRKGASYQYQTGPDGQRYAVGGEVSIDSSAVSGDPSATIRKMEQVKRAAMAPAEPSGQDRAVASAAAETEAAARQELLQQSTAANAN